MSASAASSARPRPDSSSRDASRGVGSVSFASVTEMWRRSAARTQRHRISRPGETFAWRYAFAISSLRSSTAVSVTSSGSFQEPACSRNRARARPTLRAWRGRRHSTSSDMRASFLACDSPSFPVIRLMAGA
ncbi:hypothetical protein ADK57_20205 [Streptomyces sp. MMG1533]|nr:hypothetical protein ADK57_20205 [Streptomyces sp. MMG1533]